MQPSINQIWAPPKKTKANSKFVEMFSDGLTLRWSLKVHTLYDSLEQVQDLWLASNQKSKAKVIRRHSCDYISLLRIYLNKKGKASPSSWPWRSKLPRFLNGNEFCQLCEWAWKRILPQLSLCWNFSPSQSLDCTKAENTVKPCPELLT